MRRTHLERARRSLIAVLLLSACGGESPETDAGSSTAEPAPAPAEPEAAAAPADWSGAYSVRGTLGDDQVAGTLSVAPLAAGVPAFEETRQRVQRSYPSYQGPFYTAELTAGSGADSVHATFTCAHGPAQTPPLVCEPSGEVQGLEPATLVVQPDGRAVLTGSHGEGVSVESGRLSWTRQGAQ